MPDARETPAPNPFTARIERWLFGHRGLVLAAFALLTLVMGWYAAQLRVDAGFFKLVPLKHEYMQTFLKHRDEFGGADRVVIALMAREGDMFSPEFFTVLKQVTDAMFFLPGIDRTQVASILTPNVRYIEVVEDGVIAGNVLPASFRPTPEGLARVRENAIKAGIVGRLVANDFTGAIVSGRLQEFHPNTGERLDYIEVARQLEEIRAKALAGADVDVDVHVIGFAKLVGDIAAGAARVIAFFGITFLITALFVYLYTRSVPSHHTAPGVLAGGGGVAARHGDGPGLRHRSHVHPGAVPGVRGGGQPRRADGERGARRGGGRAPPPWTPPGPASGACCCRGRWRSPPTRLGSSPSRSSTSRSSGRPRLPPAWGSWPSSSPTWRFCRCCFRISA